MLIKSRERPWTRHRTGAAHDDLAVYVRISSTPHNHSRHGSRLSPTTTLARGSRSTLRGRIATKYHDIALGDIDRALATSAKRQASSPR